MPQLLAALMVEGATPNQATELAQEAMGEAYRSWREIDRPEDWTKARASAALARRRADGTL